MSVRNDRAISLTLQIGAYASVALLVAGLAAAFAGFGTAESLMRAGVLVLLVTPVLNIGVAAFAFAREHDRRHVVIALAVLAIVLTALLLGLRR